MQVYLEKIEPIYDILNSSDWLASPQTYLRIRISMRKTGKITMKNGVKLLLSRKKIRRSRNRSGK